MRPFFLILSLFLFSSLATAQIVNTERLRVNANEQGLAGTVGFTFRFIQNTRQLFQGGVKGGIELLEGRHRALAFSNFKISRADEEDLVNDGFLHGRYNFALNKHWILEAFSQVQYNSIQKIDYRLLNGGGIRLKIVHNDSIRFYLGTTYMYEIDQFSDSLMTRRNIHRQSNYLSFGYKFTPDIVFDQVLYFQPAWTDFTDLRLSSETRFQLAISKHLAFGVYFSLLYDTRPVEDLPNLYLDLQNSLNFIF